MKTYGGLFEMLISLDNLKEAYRKAKRRKEHKASVQEFEKHWQLYLVQLHLELKTKTYIPRKLKTFILRDPKQELSV